jgi:hypothetical protein
MEKWIWLRWRRPVISLTQSGHSIANFSSEGIDVHLSKLSKSRSDRSAGAGRCGLAQKTQLLVYTALETDQLKAYQEGFNKVNPDIESSGCATPPA